MENSIPLLTYITVNNGHAEVGYVSLVTISNKFLTALSVPPTAM